jgi:hypothetical protein
MNGLMVDGKNLQPVILTAASAEKGNIFLNSTRTKISLEKDWGRRAGADTY